MALDPNEEVPRLTGFVDDPDTWPEQLPAGVTKDATTWYAHRRTYRNGRVVWEFYKRGSGGGPNGEGDAVFATVEGAPNKTVKDDWDKGQSAQQRGDQEGDTRGPQNGPTREVYRGGKWVVEPNPLHQAQTDTPEARQKAEEQREREWNRDNGGLYETHAQRRTREAKERADEEAREARNKPGAPTLKPDGQGGTIAVQVMPDGSIKTTPLPGVPSEASAKYSEVKQDPQTGQWHGLTKAGTWEPIQGGPSKPPGKDDFADEPAGAPAPNDSPGQIAQGIRAYSSWLNQQVKLWRDSGGKQGVSPEQATKLMNRRLDLAEFVVKEQQSLATNQVNIRGQDINQRGQTLQDTAGRRSTAQSLYNNAVAQVTPLIRGAGRGNGGLAADALAGLLTGAQSYVDAFGGFRESPEVGHPGFLGQLREASMAGIQTAAQGGPQIFQPRPVTAPSADPGGAEVEAARQATMAGIRANPIFRPQPPAAVPVTTNPINDQPVLPPGQLPAGVAAPAGPPARDDWSQEHQPSGTVPSVEAYPSDGPLPGTLPPVNPAAGEPGNDPSQPGGMVPPRFMQEARFGAGNYWQPSVHGVQLAQRLGIPDDILQQALAGLEA